MKSEKHSASEVQDWFRTSNEYPSTDASYKKRIRRGEFHALGLFHAAAERVPAYRDFLRRHHVHAGKVKTYQDFRSVPETTKENYIAAYETWQRTWDGTPDGTHMISTSSGTTGIPHYWPRSLRHDIDGAAIHEFFLRNIFLIHRRPTLFINGFAMGNWIAGTFTQASVSLVAWKGYPLTVMSPGYDMDAVLSVVKDISPGFRQTIIAGHTPFLKEIAEALRGVSRKRGDSVRLLGTGQGITEAWRTAVTDLVGGHDVYRTFVNLYGSADASLMGFETPVSIAIRRTIDTENLSLPVFMSERLPSVYQFDPMRTFFESVENELCITKDSGVPLIRYNIHDTGGVLSYQALLKKVKGKDISLQRKRFPWQLPFVYLFGREKFMVKIYGANIYTEHVAKVLDHPHLQRKITGRFLLDTGYDDHQNPQLIVRVEVSGTDIEDAKLIERIESLFIKEVGRINSEYRFVLSHMGDKAKPHILLYPHGHGKFFPKGVVRKTG